MSQFNQNGEPTVEVDVSGVNPDLPVGVVPGVQVGDGVIPAPDPNFLFSTDDADYVLDSGAQLTFEQQQEEIRKLQAEKARLESLQEQKQVFESGFNTMTEKLGQLTQSQQDAYQKMLEKQAADQAKLLQSRQQAPALPSYSNEQFATEIFTNPAEAVQKWALVNLGPVIQGLKQQNAQLQQRLDNVSTRSQYGDIYSKYGNEVEIQAQQLASQGVSNPYELAAKIVRGAHADELIQPNVQPAVPVQQNVPTPQPPQPTPQSYSPTAAQVPRPPQGQRVKKQIPQSLYNEWYQMALEKGLDPEKYASKKALYYEG